MLISEGEGSAIYCKPKRDATNLSDDMLYNAPVTDRLWLDITTGASHFNVNEEHLIGLSGLRGKANPVQAWAGPEGCSKLGLPDFKTAHEDSKLTVSVMFHSVLSDPCFDSVCQAMRM